MSQNNQVPQQTFKVLLQPSGMEFETAAELSLLNSALRAAIRMPSSCRNGTCRTCLCMLKSGRIRYLTEWPGLTREEKLEGCLLPCVAVAESDLVIEAADVVRLE